MIPCLILTVPPGRSTTLALSFGDTLPPWIESLTTPVSLALFAAGFFGLLVGWVMAKTGGQARRSEPTAEPTVDSPELVWRHEKLVLLERQEAERSARLQKFFTSVSKGEADWLTHAKLRLFSAAEILRDTRQRIGTDLSRLHLVIERLSALRENGAPRPEALEASLEIVSARAKRLEEVRDGLRPPGSEMVSLEASFRSVEKLSDKDRDDLILSLSLIREQLETVPSDWRTLTDEADRKVGEVLASGGEPEFETLRDVLLVDGASTASLEPGVLCSASQAVTELIEWLREAKVEARSFPLQVKPVPLAPDSRFQAPDSGESSSEGAPSEDSSAEAPPSADPPVETPSGMTATSAIEETTESTPAEDPVPLPQGVKKRTGGFHDLSAQPPSDPAKSEAPSAAAKPPQTMVVFRANDANLWGRELYRGANCRARSLEQLPNWASWISIQRLDTGERVFAPLDTFSLSQANPATSAGFNASNELFYGARHLGMFSESCPNEVETRFTYGGWGFGHRVCHPGEEEESLQASGWEGREIPADTVFEIVLHAELPELEGDDKVLASAESSPQVATSLGR